MTDSLTSPVHKDYESKTASFDRKIVTHTLHPLVVDPSSLELIKRTYRHIQECNCCRKACGEALI